MLRSTKSPLHVEPLRKFPDSLSEADRKRLRTAIENATKNDVAPRLRQVCENLYAKKYAPHGRLDPGGLSTAGWRSTLPIRRPSSDDN